MSEMGPFSDIGSLDKNVEDIVGQICDVYQVPIVLQKSLGVTNEIF
jgi:hypothetical protein